MSFFRRLNERIPRRAILGVMMFLACMFSYMIRTNLSIVIVGMTVHSNNSITNSNTSDSSISISKISYSNISDSDVLNSTITYSTSDSSHISNSNIGNSSIINSTISNSCIYNSYIIDNATIENISLCNNETCEHSDCINKTTQNSVKVAACGATLDSKGKVMNITDEQYEWSEKAQSYILSAYFIGVLPSSIPAGMLAEKFGGSKVVAFSTLIPAILNLIVPWTAHFGVGFLVFLRFLMGFFGAAIYPALHAMIAKWVPPSEKGMFVWTMQGGPFGTVVTFSICGIIMQSMGSWKVAYYITSGLILIFYAFWVFLIYDTPELHPGITQKEKTYIKEQIGTTVAKQKNALPVKAMATSGPFLVLLWAHFANMWGIYFIASNGPKYTLQVLGLNMSSGGFLTGLPYIARLGAGIVFAAAGDYLRRKELFTLKSIRKSFMIFSHAAPALCLLGMTYAGCDSTTALSMLILALAFNGAACQTSLQNHQDLAPNYAGSLYGVMNTFGSLPGFIIPLIIGVLTNKHNGIEEWRPMFWISAAVFLSATVLFWLFGSADIQPWNDLNATGVPDIAEEEKQINITKEVEPQDEEHERL